MRLRFFPSGFCASRMALVLALVLVPFTSRTVGAAIQDSDEPKDETPGINSGLVSSLSFRGIGPALMSGRIGDIAIDPVDRSIWYVVAASGGVWKTTNAGVTWDPIFDSYGSYSIGCIAIDPNDRFTIWVGTGENNSQRSVGYGDGLYKSVDGGATFRKVGLENSEHIGRIVIHPEDSNTVFVAAQGPLWKSGGDRGLYRTKDGGKTWEKVLDISENTGVNEVHMDPFNPDILYASSYQRRRHTWVLIDGGPESTIYRSTDGGSTWNKSDRGLPGGDKGKIGMAISPVNPEVVYAIVEAADGQSGFYRSTNRGLSWERRSDHVSGSPQYYNEIVACPHKLDRVYSLDTMMMVTEDGGASFSTLGEADKHVDNHALVIDPADERHLLAGCDGGLYESWDRGQTWEYTANLPITQFYKVAVSNDLPFYYVYGGTQDNATQGGPSRTNNVHGIRNSDWFITVFGDGFDPAVDPEDPDTIYSQWQYGGLVRYNRKTGLNVDIKPQEAAGGEPLRWNWDSALEISPHNSKRIYYAAQMLFASDDRGDNWTAISGDLTKKIDRNKLMVMGRVWSVDAVAKNSSTSLYGTIVALSESPRVKGLIYAGTDDGMFSVTGDNGQTWKQYEKFGTLDVPEFGYINDIIADKHDDNTVYACVNNHKRGDFRPYIVKSTDRGETWTSITGDLPERGTVYTIRQDHVNPKLLFCGTEFACYFTIDGGNKWIELGSGLPPVAVRDIEVQERENDLVLATFGRGFYILDDYSPLRDLKRELLETNHIFPVRTGKMYMEADVLGVPGKGFQGAGFYTAPNPEYGVTFTYYVKDSLKTKKATRKEEEGKLKAAGKDTPYPEWDALKAEDREIPPVRWLTIRDEQGAVVNRLQASTSKGMHRINWNFQHAVASSGGRRRGGMGPLAAPGKYTIGLTQMVDGQVTELVPAVAFEIQPLGFENFTEPDRAGIVAFCKQANKLAIAVNAASAVAEEAQTELDRMLQVVESNPELDVLLLNDIRAVKTKLMDVMEKFNGDPTKPSRNEAAYPGFTGRIITMMFGAMGSYEGPTGTHKAQYNIVDTEFTAALAELKGVLETDIIQLRGKLDAAGAPWTPGRKIPDWK